MGEVVDLVEFRAAKEADNKTRQSKEVRLQLRSHFSEVDEWLHDTINIYIDQAVLRDSYSFTSKYGGSIHESFNKARNFNERQKCRIAQRQLNIVGDVFDADRRELSGREKHGLLMMAYVKGTVEERVVAALRSHPKVEAGLPAVYDFSEMVSSASWSTALQMYVANVRPASGVIDDLAHAALSDLVAAENKDHYYRFAQPRRYAAYVANNLAAGYYETHPYIQNEQISYADMPERLADATGSQMIELARQGVRPEELMIWAGATLMYSQIEAEHYIESLD